MFPATNKLPPYTATALPFVTTEVPTPTLPDATIILPVTPTPPATTNAPVVLDVAGVPGELNAATWYALPTPPDTIFKVFPTLLVPITRLPPPVPPCTYRYPSFAYNAVPKLFDCDPSHVPLVIPRSM